MDSRARVAAALAGEEVDRPPAGAWGHTYMDEWSPERLAEVTVQRARRYGWDFVKFQPRATFFAEAFGARFRPSGNAYEAPVLESTPLSGAGSWEEVRLADFGVMEQQARALGLVTRALGDAVPVLQTVFSPISVAAYLAERDRGRLAAELSSRPEALLAALERIGDALIDFSRISVEAGASGVFYAISNFATPDAMSRDVYDQRVLPGDRRILEALPEAAWFNVLHLCGPRVWMDLGRELPVQGVSYSTFDEGNPSLAEARRLTGKAVMGGLEQRRVLVEGPVSDIERQVRGAIAETGGRGLLLAPGCSVPPAAPAANLQTMMEAAS